MSQAPENPPFKANPIEVLIFLLIGSVFAHSFYNLLYLHRGFHPKVLSKMASQPLSEGRSPAAAPSLAEMELTCAPSIEFKTAATKIKLKGRLCQFQSTSSLEKSVQAEVINKNNSVQATVFLNGTTQRFSTEYFNLAPGQNLIQVHLSYPDQTSFDQDVLIFQLGQTKP